MKAELSVVERERLGQLFGPLAEYNGGQWYASGRSRHPLIIKTYAFTMALMVDSEPIFGDGLLEDVLGAVHASVEADLEWGLVFTLYFESCE